jgi:DNA-binding LacI/PurR family transcriptional regulator
VVGFDDAVPTAGVLGLTTVQQPHRVKGEKAGAAILALLAGTHPIDQLLPTKLVVRASSTPPPS